MRRLEKLAGIMLATTVMMWSCVADTTEKSVGIEPDTVESKLVFTSEGAVRGQLLVYFDEDVVERVEAGVSRSEYTRSGIEDFDMVLDNIGTLSMKRLFPVDSRNEARTREAGLHRWYIIEFDTDADMDAAARALANVAEVSNVEFNQQMVHVTDGKVTPLDENEVSATMQTRATTQFNDTYLAKQWDMINTGDTSIYSQIKAGADVNCQEAWRYCTGDTRVIVAIVDDCVEWDHSDLAVNMWTNSAEKSGSEGVDDDGNGYADDIYGYNFVADSKLAKSTTGDSASHGTHVAGTVAAVNNNGKGVCGIAGGSGRFDGVKLMSCQVFYNDKGGSSSITAKAIKYAADNGAAIIQCSYGYTAGAVASDTVYANTAEKQAIDYFIATKNCDAVDGGIVIFAAGNDASSVSCYPGAYRDYISVTAMSCDFTPAYYTNYGPGCNIAAPGGDAYQGYFDSKGTNTTQIISTTLYSKYGYMQGTSMACPHVSGVAALGLSYALQLGKSFTRNEFNTLLLTSVNDINQYCTGTKSYVTDSGSRGTLQLSTYNGKMGTGYIDAFKVLMNVRGITCIPVATGSQRQIDIQPYLGSGDLGMKLNDVSISSEDMTRLGMTSAPTIFGNKILIKCANTGSAIIKVSMTAGEGNNSGMYGLPITKEFALVARENLSENGGWL